MPIGIRLISATSTLLRLRVDIGRLVLVCSMHYNEFTATEALETSFLHWRCFQRQFWTSEVLKPSGTEGILKPRRSCVYVLHDSALSPRSVSSCCQLLHGWAAVALRCSHFTITALTVDLGSWRRTEISLPCLERLQVCDLIKSLSSSQYTVLLASVCLRRLHGAATVTLFI